MLASVNMAVSALHCMLILRTRTVNRTSQGLSRREVGKMNSKPTGVKYTSRKFLGQGREDPTIAIVLDFILRCL